MIPPSDDNPGSFDLWDEQKYPVCETSLHFAKYKMCEFTLEKKHQDKNIHFWCLFKVIFYGSYHGKSPSKSHHLSENMFWFTFSSRIVARRKQQVFVGDLEPKHFLVVLGVAFDRVIKLPILGLSNKQQVDVVVVI